MSFFSGLALAHAGRDAARRAELTRFPPLVIAAGLQIMVVAPGAGFFLKNYPEWTTNFLVDPHALSRWWPVAGAFAAAVLCFAGIASAWFVQRYGRVEAVRPHLYIFVLLVGWYLFRFRTRLIFGGAFNDWGAGASEATFTELLDFSIFNMPLGMFAAVYSAGWLFALTAACFFIRRATRAA